MRDPKRIPTIIKELERIWLKNPDIRLGQLIMASNPANDYDFFYTEDKQLINNIKSTWDFELDTVKVNLKKEFIDKYKDTK